MNAPVADPRVIVALDYANRDDAITLAKQLNPIQCRLKVGKELFTRCGPAVVASLQELGFDVFLDLKFHDIPNTVAKACAAAAELGVWMVNVHASGGQRMMQAAREALEAVPTASRPLLIGVTVLTSMDQSDLAEVGIPDAIDDQVQRLAELTEVSGLDGVVCSAQEAVELRRQRRTSFKLVTPGIRLANDNTNQHDKGDDQRRIVTPELAIQQGADYLVIGRPITQAADPQQVLEKVNQRLS